jgi:ADP-L-glycero-D-manno-heptose 6-epimerase
MQTGHRPRLFKSGEQKRDHIYVKDCVLANLAALDAPSGIYNVGTGIGTSFNDLVRLLNDALSTDLAPEYFEMPYDRRTYQANTQADINRARSVLRFTAQFDLPHAIAEYIPMLQ